METVVFRGVSRKQRENREKQGKKELRAHSYICLGVFSQNYIWSTLVWQRVQSCYFLSERKQIVSFKFRLLTAEE